MFSPCPTGWRFPPAKLIEVSRKAVETNVVPLWEYTKEEGKLHFTRSVDNPLPVQEYLKLVGKFRHMDKDQIAHTQKHVEKTIKTLKGFAQE